MGNGLTVKERLTSLEVNQNRIEEVNKKDHEAILKEVGDCKKMLGNHLIHYRKIMKWIVGIMGTAVGIWGATKINGICALLSRFFNWLISL